MPTYKLPAGTYYIGDICYALDSEIYSDVWADKHNCQYGKYVIKGYNFVVHGTSDGDGFYPSNSHIKKFYPVDAGNIGIVHETLIGKDKYEKAHKLGTMHTFSGIVTFKYNNGTFEINCDADNFHLEIYT